MARTTIICHLNDGNLWSGEERDPWVNQAASEDRFYEMLTDAICAEYPTAEVRLRRRRNTVGCGCGFEVVSDEMDEDQACEGCEQIMTEVLEDGDWCVLYPRLWCAFISNMDTLPVARVFTHEMDAYRWLANRQYQALREVDDDMPELDLDTLPAHQARARMNERAAWLRSQGYEWPSYDVIPALLDKHDD